MSYDQLLLGITSSPVFPYLVGGVVICYGVYKVGMPIYQKAKKRTENYRIQDNKRLGKEIAKEVLGGKQNPHLVEFENLKSEVRELVGHYTPLMAHKELFKIAEFRRLKDNSLTSRTKGIKLKLLSEIFSRSGIDVKLAKTKKKEEILMALTDVLLEIKDSEKKV